MFSTASVHERQAGGSESLGFRRSMWGCVFLVLGVSGVTVRNAFKTRLDWGRPNLFYTGHVYSYHRHGSLYGEYIGSGFLYVDKALREIPCREYLSSYHIALPSALFSQRNYCFS